MSKPSLVIVLAEDQRFARRLLYKAGFEPHDIRFEPLPGNRGSGEQWVREHYAGAVERHRERSARASTVLVTILDADVNSVAERARQLATELKAAHIHGRGPQEAIVHLIPRRNIETWILALNQRPVDEETDYRHESGIDPLIEPAARTFHEWSSTNAQVPSVCLPSLLAAFPEFRRLTASRATPARSH